MSGYSYLLIYALLGIGTTGIGSLKSTNEIKEFVEKYGKVSLYSLLGTVTVLFPVAVILGGVMYWGKTKQANKKTNVQDLVEVFKPAQDTPKE